MANVPEYRVPIDYAPARENHRLKFFNQVYAWMFVGLAVTAITAWFASQSVLVIRNPFIAVAAMIGSVIMAWTLRSVTMRLSAAAGLAMFIAYAALVGVMICGIFLRYKLEMLGGAFLVTGGVFGGMSITGYVTKRDLSGMGGILMMAVWGLFLGAIVNIFMHSTAFGWLITYGVLIVFIGLTAYDTQKLRVICDEYADQPDVLSRFAVIGSLELYLDFLNLFLSILRIMNSKR